MLMTYKCVYMREVLHDINAKETYYNCNNHNLNIKPKIEINQIVFYKSKKIQAIKINQIIENPVPSNLTSKKILQHHMISLYLYPNHAGA